MDATVLAFLLVLGVFLLCVARLITHAAAQRLLDIAATVLVGVVLVVDVLALH
jgi:hypothetical protein